MDAVQPGVAVDMDVSSVEKDLAVDSGAGVSRPTGVGVGVGAGGQVALADVRETALSVDECLAAVASDGVGGTALFVGTVRNRDHGIAVVELEYTAHPMARAEIERVAAQVAATTGVLAVAAVHRVGVLAVGDLAVVVAAGAAHRAEAFAACRQLIDRIKESAPIWKRQVFENGSAEWVGGC